MSKSPCGMMVAAALALTACHASAETQPILPEAFSGRWIGIGVEQLPGSRRQPGPIERREAARSTLAFAASAFTGPEGIGCSNPHYTIVSLPPEGLFQGALASRDAADDADRLGFPGSDIPTLRVDCDNASFDFHLAGPTSLRWALDGLIYTFERPVAESGRPD